MDAILQVFENWAWIGWLVLIAVFLVIEMLTLDFTFLMLALGSAVGLLSDVTGLPLWAQVIIAAAAAAAFILLIRPPLLRRLHRGEDATKSNVEALVGLHGVVLLEVSTLTGQVKLSNGDTWTARLAADTPVTTPLSPGTPITVGRIEGATAYVLSAHE
ncbi:membrane protein implicated in regulation of membrane protease activity [Microbacterium resistens]|uniref:Membrane protein implicated in regulation of membrane protease activity n=1 Tax=Microbacterium resistens TaxID=156977 RepID=A0ABU1SH61_9MICO|nr:NfeD family protein [Microbacterium resistens]MDR6868207.1 membrane protein implicated in regulation of membrane protease activity [Microbacterium resistens]